MNTTLAIPSVSWPLRLEKLFSVLVVVVALTFLKPVQFLEAVIALGQGHFFACYYYQYKYHKMNRAYLIRYFIGLVVIFGAYILYPNLFLLVTLTSIQFVVHLSADERFLWKEAPSLKRGLAFFPFVLIYAGMIIDGVYVGYANLDFWLVKAQNLKFAVLGVWLTPYCLGAAGVVVFGYFALVWKKKLTVERHDLHFLLAAFGLAILYFIGQVPNLYYLMGVPILFHYSSWYVHYGLRYKDDATQRNCYLKEMLVINALVLGLYSLYHFFPDILVVKFIPHEIYPFKSPIHGNVLAYLFSPAYFYLWTWMHFVSTARRSDLAYLKV